jgi:hypothetical protein
LFDTGFFTAETHDCRDAGGRVTQGAVTERAPGKPEKNHRRDAEGAENTKKLSPQRRKERKGKLQVNPNVIPANEGNHEYGIPILNGFPPDRFGHPAFSPYRYVLYIARE